MDKQYLNYLNFISDVKLEKSHMIFASDYVVLSKKAYEILINYHHPELKIVSFNELVMNDWIKERFLKNDPL